jgi:hypothetical protein
MLTHEAKFVPGEGFMIPRMFTAPLDEDERQPL